jgi:RNase P protein component
LVEAWDLVVIARPGAADLGLVDVEKQFDGLASYLNRRKRTAGDDR